MKKFLVLVMAAFMVAACESGFKSKSYRLAEGSDILTFSAQAENGDTLWGVKLADGTVLIEPVAMTFVMDKSHGILIARNKAGARTYYTLSGKNIGEIAAFKPLACQDLIYQGYAKGKTVLYFAEGEKIIEADAAYLSSGYLGYQTPKEGFIIVSTQGETTTFSVPVTETGFVWVDGQPAVGRPSQPKIVVLEKKQAVVYDLRGNEEKKLPYARWNSLTKKIGMTPLGNGQRCKIETEL